MFFHHFNSFKLPLFGFRKKMSTSDAVTDCVKYTYDRMDDDCVAIRKLCAYGVRGGAIKWFLSYLMGRKQNVSINNATYRVCYIECGILQRSIYGPLLLQIFNNNFLQSSYFFS